MSRTTLSAGLLMLLSSHMASADSNTPPTPISTDRPAVTDSSIVVSKGMLQFENGLTDTVNHGVNELDAPATLLRLGIASKTELRLTIPDYFGQLNGPSGFGDLVLGLKQQLGPIHGFDVSLVVSVSLPSGSRAYSSRGYDPFVQLPWSRSLSANWTAAGMLSVYFPTEGNRRNTTGETTFLFDRQLTKPWDAFLEYVGDFPERGGTRHQLHMGTAYKWHANEQFDLHFGVGLSAPAVDHYIGIGYSFRL